MKEYKHCTLRAQQVLETARELARSRGSSKFDTLHLLSALIAKRDGMSRHVLRHLGIDLADVHMRIEKVIGQESWLAQEQNVEPTDSVVQALWHAARDTCEFWHRGVIDDDNLLLGIMKEQQSAAGTLLRDLGLTESEIRKELLAIIMPAA